MTNWKFIPTTNSNHGLAVCDNLLNRQFQAERAGEKWASYPVRGRGIARKASGTGWENSARRYARA